MSQTQTSHASVIVSSDRASDGTYSDTSGPAASAWLGNHGFVVGPITVVADEWDQLAAAITKAVVLGQHLVVISGGTGLGSRDITPQVVDKLCDYAIPGFGELLRRESLKYSLNAYLSRCGGWVKDGTLVLALPGNPKAVVEQLGILSDILPHALKSLRNACEHRRKTTEAHA